MKTLPMSFSFYSWLTRDYCLLGKEIIITFQYHWYNNEMRSELEYHFLSLLLLLGCDARTNGLKSLPRELQKAGKRFS